MHHHWKRALGAGALLGASVWLWACDRPTDLMLERAKLAQIAGNKLSVPQGEPGPAVMTVDVDATTRQGDVVTDDAAEATLLLTWFQRREGLNATPSNDDGGLEALSPEERLQARPIPTSISAGLLPGSGPRPVTLAYPLEKVLRPVEPPEDPAPGCVVENQTLTTPHAMTADGQLELLVLGRGHLLLTLAPQPGQALPATTALRLVYSDRPVTVIDLQRCEQAGQVTRRDHSLELQGGWNLVARQQMSFPDPGGRPYPTSVERVVPMTIPVTARISEQEHP